MAVCMARCEHKTPRKKGLGSARTPQQQEIGRRNTVTHARGKAPPSCCLQAAAVSLSRQPSGPARFELGWRGHVTARGILHCTAARCRQRCSASCLLSSRRLGSASLLVRSAGVQRSQQAAPPPPRMGLGSWEPSGGRGRRGGSSLQVQFRHTARPGPTMPVVPSSTYRDAPKRAAL